MSANSLPGSIRIDNWGEKRNVYITIHSSIRQPVLGDGSQTSMMGFIVRKTSSGRKNRPQLPLVEECIWNKYFWQEKYNNKDTMAGML